ncbi:MAG TPA: DUF3326 domain-containing protein, partial [bacterium]|nr:DUF3326 domain-containing protein [bacterium]
GVGAEIGGHAGDATPAANLIASVCDNLITHPNVVNASDINEMPSNALYVTGATIDDLLQGYSGIRKVRSNRIAVLVNKSVSADIINLVSAARAIMGIDAFIVELPEKLRMIAEFANDGQASGTISGAQEAAEYLIGLDEYGAVAVITDIEIEKEVALHYVTEGGVNPWGGVEAKLTRIMTDILKVPVAHAPFGHTLGADWSEITDPRMAAEMISMTYGFCLLKGLHRAPEIVDSHIGITVEDIDVMISPDGLYGTPHECCEDHNIPVIYVRENKCIVQGKQYQDLLQKLPQDIYFASTYLEAAGMIQAMKLGISFESITRPLSPTQVL